MHAYNYSDHNIVHLLGLTSFLKKKNDLKHLVKKRRFFLTQKLLKVTISQKLSIAQKISFIYFNLPCKFDHFLKKVEFLERRLRPSFARKF